MFILPLFVIGLAISVKYFASKGIKLLFLGCFLLQCLFTFCFSYGFVKDPERNPYSQTEKDPSLFPNFELDLASYSDYKKLNLVLRYYQQKEQKERLLPIIEKTGQTFPLLYELNQRREMEERQKFLQTVSELEASYAKIMDEFPSYLKSYLPYSHELAIAGRALKEGKGDLANLQKNYDKAFEEEKKARKVIDEAESVIYRYRYAKARTLYVDKKNQWLKSERLHMKLNPFLRSFHWEEDAGGGQTSNPNLPWFERTRLNRKDLGAALIFGVRVSLIVGFSAVFLSLAIGIPLGLFAGYFAGKVDMIVLRFIEIWEAMPTFFTLLLISAIFHNKSLFLTIIVLGLFSWTGFARFIRAESLRERGLAYVMASKSLGFHNGRIMFSHVLPNAISPILALLPFSMMAAITSEAALSFLGLGEENSTSWGVLMSEARTVFPGESYLLWPPALLLTAFLVAIALVGDGLRDALDPKMQN